MASPELWNDYFDNPTLSDLTIRLSDRLVHVHRVVLCRGSQYFEKLLTGSFKETGAKEIELHEDDPVTLLGALRYIYGLDYDEVHMNAVGDRQFLAVLFVTAAKYQLNGLENKTYEDMVKITTADKLPIEDPGPVNDFLTAVETVLAGTTQDCRMRKLMVNCCFWNLAALSTKATRLSDLITEHPDLGAKIITSLGSSHNPFEGSWYCEGKWHPNAQPCCFVCEEPFSKQYMLSHRNKEFWHCTSCEGADHPPHCFEITCTKGSPDPVVTTWVWEANYHEE